MRKLEVRMAMGSREATVGTIALDARRFYFEYHPDFIATGIELSPIKLPLRPGLQEHTDREFGPLFGLFADSLPDGWGLLLMDREFRRRRKRIAELTALDRLGYIGTRAMGALTYHPAESAESGEFLDLAEMARASALILRGSAAEVIPALRNAGGSAAGARPKVLVGVNPSGDMITGTADVPAGYDHYIIKFNAEVDPLDVGAIEIAYAHMAQEAGIDVPPVRMFETSAGNFFGARRFDRMVSQRVHMHTASGLLHADHRLPSLDYETLLHLTRELTKDERQVAQMFRRMVFNVLLHNRDDHAKNFSFLMTPDGAWRLSPAYDLVYSEGPGGEHSTSVAGEGYAPAYTDMMAVAQHCAFDADDAEAIIEEVRSVAARWVEFAADAGVGLESRSMVADRLALLQTEK